MTCCDIWLKSCDIKLLTFMKVSLYCFLNWSILKMELHVNFLRQITTRALSWHWEIWLFQYCRNTGSSFNSFNFQIIFLESKLYQNSSQKANTFNNFRHIPSAHLLSFAKSQSHIARSQYAKRCVVLKTAKPKLIAHFKYHWKGAWRMRSDRA